MKRILSAAMLVVGLMAAPVMAQDNAATMEVGLSMLELSVGKTLAQYGIRDVDPMSLSLGQLAEIKGIVSSSDWSKDEKEKAIKATIANR
jgi:hypothetical protein